MGYGVGERPIALALTGDILLTRRASVFKEPMYLELMDILRKADGVFGNLETTIRNWDEGHPALGGLGTYMTTPPTLLDDIKWMGFNLLSCANNHAPDFGEGGVFANIRHLDAAGLVHAGTGGNLAEARAPAYLDTDAGRIALIAATAAFREGTQAGAQGAHMKGRPGLNPLAFERIHSVDRQAYDELKRMARALGYEREQQRSKSYYGQKDQAKEVGGELRLFKSRFALGDEFAITTKPSRTDQDAIVTWVKEAKRQADFVIVSIHYHEMGGANRLAAATREDLDEPGDFVPMFSRAVIDAGADVVAGHGPHYPLGIEIYRGRPILYSLGNFLCQTETVERLPQESYVRLGLPEGSTPGDFVDVRTDKGTRGHAAKAIYWESIAVTCKMDKDGTRELLVYPLDLGHGTVRSQRGRPILATGQKAEHILEKMRKMSVRYGTTLTVDNGVGRIAVS